MAITLNTISSGKNLDLRIVACPFLAECGTGPKAFRRPALQVARRKDG
ncbi:MAG TPA: hypothetical protein VFJ13_11825 [Paracoccaceae bacterium]|nr:hypothetical protein [Paracoccaceae bacterium]